MRRRGIWFWAGFCAASVVLGATPQTPVRITLHVRDADVREVLASVAATSGLELAIAQDVAAKVTIDIDDAPLDRALARIAAAAEISARIDEGRLIVSRAERTPAAPTLPDSLRSLPRILLSDYEKHMSELPPLTLRLRTGEKKLCYQLLFKGSQQGAVRVSPADLAGSLDLIQLAYDPVGRTRYVAIDAGSAKGRAVLPVPPGEEVSWDGAPDTWAVTLNSTDEGSGCAVLAGGPAVGHLGDGSEAVLAHAELRARKAKSPDEVLFGWCVVEGRGGASVLSARHGRGQMRDWSLYSYAPADGSSLAFVLGMGAVWTDPTDGREYYFSQFSQSEGFLILKKEGATGLTLPAGGATAAPVELRVYAENERWACASRAAGRSPRR